MFFHSVLKLPAARRDGHQYKVVPVSIWLSNWTSDWLVWLLAMASVSFQRLTYFFCPVINLREQRKRVCCVKIKLYLKLRRCVCVFDTLSHHFSLRLYPNIWNCCLHSSRSSVCFFFFSVLLLSFCVVAVVSLCCKEDVIS